MNAESTIQFIKSSKGIHLDKSSFYKSLIVFSIMFFLVVENSQELGRGIVIASAVVLSCMVVANILYWFAMVKNQLQKHKLILRPVILLNCVAPLFYICCISFYDIFGFKKCMFYYLLPFFVVFCIFVVVGFMIIRINKERKSTASYSLLCGVLLGMSVLISRKVNEIMVENMSANMHFLVIALLTLLVNGFTTSVMFFDVIRYYYFTKLEKMGLVTEDILKLDK